MLTESKFVQTNDFFRHFVVCTGNLFDITNQLPADYLLKPHRYTSKRDQSDKEIFASLTKVYS